MTQNNQSPSFPQAPDRNPTVAIITTVVLAGVVTALSLFLIGRLLIRYLPTEVYRCNLDNPCEDGSECRQGQCVEGPVEVACRAGDALDTGCYCFWEKVDGRCTREPPAPPTCDDELSTLLDELKFTLKDCSAKLKGADVTS